MRHRWVSTSSVTIVISFLVALSASTVTDTAPVALSTSKTWTLETIRYFRGHLKFICAKIIDSYFTGTKGWSRVIVQSRPNNQKHSFFKFWYKTNIPDMSNDTIGLFESTKRAKLWYSSSTSTQQKPFRRPTESCAYDLAARIFFISATFRWIII